MQLYHLKKERASLRLTIGFETFFAFQILLMKILELYWRHLDPEGKEPFFRNSGILNHIYFFLISEEALVFILYIFFPLVCWILFIMLFTFWNRNEETPVTTRLSAWILLLCTILPVEIQFVHTGFMGEFYPTFNTVMECWIYLCLPLTQLLLFRDLRRYTKAIRAREQREAQKLSQASPPQ